MARIRPHRASEAATGKVAWDQPGLTLTDGGELVLFAADPAGDKELGRTQACGVTWCNPAYADGRLYLRDAKELVYLERLK